MLWVRIRKDPHLFGNLDPHQHQIKIRIRIRIKIYKLDLEPNPDPRQFADVKPKCIEYEPILALIQGFEPFFKARIQFRIRIREKSRIRIRINVMQIHNTDDRIYSNFFIAGNNSGDVEYAHSSYFLHWLGTGRYVR